MHPRGNSNAAFPFLYVFDQSQVKEYCVQFSFMHQASFSLRKKKSLGDQLFHLKPGLISLQFGSFSNLKKM